VQVDLKVILKQNIITKYVGKNYSSNHFLIQYLYRHPLRQKVIKYLHHKKNPIYLYSEDKYGAVPP
jgi:hypothetical protein